MGVTNIVLNNAKTAVVNLFDSYTHMAWGTSNTAFAVGQTDLAARYLTDIFSETSVKNVTAGTYEFNGQIGLTEGNGSTIQEVGVFAGSIAGDDMAVRQVLPTPIGKTSSKEITTGIIITVTVSNTT